MDMHLMRHPFCERKRKIRRKSHDSKRMETNV